MKKRFKEVYQFKITLKDTKPPIWRRIQVPKSYTFWDLHVAIQDAMGWLDYHLHVFRIPNPSTGLIPDIGIPEEVYGEYGDTLAGWNKKMADWFTLENRKSEYLYDYGDSWVHLVELEKVLPKEKGMQYPICTGGRRACPPEDCGGLGAYARFVGIMSDPDHEDHELMRNWVGGDFDPKHFDKKKVIFDDPEERLDNLLE